MIPFESIFRLLFTHYKLINMKHINIYIYMK